MRITPEQIEERLAQLRADQGKVLATIEQLKANLSAYQGAIEDCEFWLAAVSAETPEAETPKRLPIALKKP